MTPHEFALEHWKLYETYIERKERVIEVATTIYLAFASALISRDRSFWLSYSRTSYPKFALVAILVLLTLTALMVVWFVKAQMRHRTKGARISTASQTTMTRWLHQSPDQNDLEPVSLADFGGVQFPKALAEEILTPRGGDYQSWRREKAVGHGLRTRGVRAHRCLDTRLVVPRFACVGWRIALDDPRGKGK
jgi:hypothetical protein